MLEGVDKNNNLIGSVYYPDGDSATDLALELVKNVSILLMPYNLKPDHCYSIRNNSMEGTEVLFVCLFIYF